ncbi:hypothetical protein BE20_29765, partial [Sorangium cellulosum]
ARSPRGRRGAGPRGRPARGVRAAGRRAKQPERVAAAHAAALGDAGAALPPDVVEEIGRRAVEHHEEWFDAPEAALALLRRLVELVPGSLWGFERLKLAYNAAERWEDLFALYDAMLERTSAPDERIFLLEDAAAVARDLAGDGERTMRYLEQLLPLQDDARTRAALERLYERHGRHRPLIDLLTAELPRLSGEAAERLRERIALLWIEGVGEAASALPAIEQLLDAWLSSRAPGAPRAAFALLERILAAIPPEQAPRARSPRARRGSGRRSCSRGITARRGGRRTSCARWRSSSRAPTWTTARRSCAGSCGSAATPSATSRARSRGSPSSSSSGRRTPAIAPSSRSSPSGSAGTTGSPRSSPRPSRAPKARSRRSRSSATPRSSAAT